MLQGELRKTVFLHVCKIYCLLCIRILSATDPNNETIFLFLGWFLFVCLERSVSQHFPELTVDMQRIRFMAKYAPKCIISDTFMI